MGQSLNKSYPLEHWVFTLVLGPLLAALYKSIFYSLSDGGDYISLYLLILVYSIGLSFPVLVIYYLSFFLLVEQIKNVAWLKVFLNAIVWMGIFTTYKLTGGLLFQELAISYIVVSGATSFFLKIWKEESQEVL